MMRKLAMVIAIAALAGSGAWALAELAGSSGTTVSVCVKRNSGQVRTQKPDETACRSSEEPMTWVVGGVVTRVDAGLGLVGGGDEGDTSLSIDPGVVQQRVTGSCRERGLGISAILADGSVSCAEGCDCGSIRAGFNDGPGELPGGNGATIAELDLPAGAWAVFAKLTVSGPPGQNFASSVSCRLAAGADFDEATLDLADPLPDVQGGHASGGMTLMVAHRFHEPGSVVLTCSDGFVISGGVVDGDLRFSDLKLIAIPASGLLNTSLGAG